MKRVLVMLFLILLIMPAVAQQPRPYGPYPPLDIFIKWVLTGQETYTYKTLTSPTITSPTITGTGSIIVSSAEINGTITLANDETIANSTDAQLLFTFNDDATTLGTVFITSSVDSPNTADNDKFVVNFQANDDSSGLDNFASIEATFLDVTDETEDGQLAFKVLTAGSATTPLTLLGSTLKLANGEVIDNGTDAQIKFTDGTNTLATIIDGGTTGSLTMTAGAEFNGNIVLQNDETIANSTDGDVVITFDDDNATLGEIYISSSIDSPLVADNDLWNIHFQANDDTSTLENWVTLEAKILDVTDETEDSQLAFKTFLAGAAKTSLTLSGNTLTLSNGEAINNTTDGTIAFTDGTNTLMSVIDSGSVGKVLVTGELEVESIITVGNGVIAGSATFDDGASADTLALTGVDANDIAIATFTSDPGSPGAHWTVTSAGYAVINTDAAVTGTPTWAVVVFRKD